MPTPNYGLPLTPDSTPLAELGQVMRDFAETLDEVLTLIDGADPQGGGQPFPAPLRTTLVTSGVNVTSGTWANIGTARDFVTTRAVMCAIAFAGAPLGGASTTMRARLSWSGATSGNSYDQLGSFAGCLNGMANTARDAAAISTTVALAAGTTTFRLQALREIGTATSNIADVSLIVTPIAWADSYVGA